MRAFRRRPGSNIDQSGAATSAQDRITSRTGRSRHTSMTACATFSSDVTRCPHEASSRDRQTKKATCGKMTGGAAPGSIDRLKEATRPWSSPQLPFSYRSRVVPASGTFRRGTLPCRRPVLPVDGQHCRSVTIITRHQRPDSNVWPVRFVRPTHASLQPR